MTLLRTACLAGLILMLGSGCASTKVHAPVASAQAGKNQHWLITVPAGTYEVGSTNHEMNPLRKVQLSTFRISDAETSNAQFTRFVAATGYVTDAEKLGYSFAAREGMLDWAWGEVPGAAWRAPYGPAGERAARLSNHPVTQISGADAEAYCRWVGGRLPTIEEWEVAARAGSRGRWPWAGGFDLHQANVWNGATHTRNTREDGWVYTSPVRSFPPNAWGLYDVIGNVFEYCAGMPGGFQPEDFSRLVAGRGGSWWCSEGTCGFFNVEDIGTMDRHGSLPNQGFRVVFDP